MSEDGQDISTPEGGIVARLAPSFLIRSLVVAIVCLVLGLWGIWDYVEVIPAQERHFARAEVTRVFLRIAEPVLSGEHTVNQELIDEFVAKVVDDLEVEGGPSVAADIEGLRASVASGGRTAIDAMAVLLTERVLPEAVAEVAGESKGEGSDRSRWFAAEAGMIAAVRSPTTGLGGPSDILKSARLAADNLLAAYGEVQQPSAYDRPVQWLFILCLPFVPWYLWQVATNIKRRFVLSDDGVLTLPGDEVWAPEDLADIDMHRWMRASKAWVVHTDGHRVLLDDYVFKGMFRIVGALASRKYPGDWTVEAKLVKKEAEDAASKADDDSESN